MEGRCPQRPNSEKKQVAENGDLPCKYNTWQIKKGDKVAIMGLGPAGIFFVQYAKLLGAEHVWSTDRNALRLSQAEKFGADKTVLRKNEWVNGG